ILRQTIGKPNPRQLVAGMSVVARRHGLGLIEAAGRDVDLVGILVAVERQLGAAMGAEAAAGLAARAEVRRIARDPSKLGRPDAEPGHERRAGRSSANGTMAIRLVERRAGHLVPNPAAKASALQHLDLPATTGGARPPQSACRTAASSTKPANRI